MNEQTITGRFVFPVDGVPLERGSVTVAGERIAAVNAVGERRADVDLGNVAIVPGFVNAHTHLDLSGMRGVCPPTRDFTAWLRAVIMFRMQRTAEQTEADIAAGLAECQRYGTTLVGDIASGGLSWRQMSAAPLWGVVFHELLGLTAERAEAAFEQATTWLDAHTATQTCRPGLSPHAPYSVRKELFERVAQRVSEDSLPVAIHLAETEAEIELLQHRSGPFVDFLRERGVWDPDGLVESIDWVVERFAGASNALLVHGNYLEDRLLTRLVSPGNVVYCPRTWAAFGHEAHPFREMLERGVHLALGTDSLASNPDLDVLAEARFLHGRHPELPGEVLLRMATLSGAEALGWSAATGSLTVGKSADLAVVALPEKESADPYELLFGSETGVRQSMWRGRWRKCS